LGSAIINDPRLGFAILMILTLADLIFRSRQQKGSEPAKADFFDYEIGPKGEPGSGANIVLIVLKLSPPFLIALIWAAAEATKSGVIAYLYEGILGFAIMLYLIINLRYIESVLIERLVRKRKSDLSGRITIGRRFSLGQSAIQIFSIFVILLFVCAIDLRPLFIGMAAAPLSLLFRNLFLIRI